MPRDDEQVVTNIQLYRDNKGRTVEAHYTVGDVVPTFIKFVGTARGSFVTIAGPTKIDIAFDIPNCTDVREAFDRFHAECTKQGQAMQDVHNKEIRLRQLSGR